MVAVEVRTTAATGGCDACLPPCKSLVPAVAICLCVDVVIARTKTSQSKLIPHNLQSIFTIGTQRISTSCLLPVFLLRFFFLFFPLVLLCFFQIPSCCYFLLIGGRISL